MCLCLDESLSVCLALGEAHDYASTPMGFVFKLDDWLKLIGSGGLLSLLLFAILMLCWATRAHLYTVLQREAV